jgi:hypothetical protein
MRKTETFVTLALGGLELDYWQNNYKKINRKSFTTTNKIGSNVYMLAIVYYIQDRKKWFSFDRKVVNLTCGKHTEKGANLKWRIWKTKNSVLERLYTIHTKLFIQ